MATFDATASGVTVETHALAVTDRLLLGVRFDHMDAGGLLCDPEPVPLFLRGKPNIIFVRIYP